VLRRRTSYHFLGWWLALACAPTSPPDAAVSTDLDGSVEPGEDARARPDLDAAIEDTPAPLDAGRAPRDASAAPDAAGADAGPPPECDVRRFGAAGDGRIKDTAAIQAAIDTCAGRGGRVSLRDGTFLSGMIRLRSDVVLHIDPTATLLGTQDDADYPTTDPPTANTQLRNCRKALVYAESARNIRIEGGGTIHGNGDTAQWLGPSTVHPEATRPMAIYTALSRDVTIQDITIKNAAMWALVNLEGEGITIRHVNIDSPLSGNRDGIDIVDCHHVLIETSTISSEDDSICIKSGSRRGVDDLIVRKCHIKQSIVANGLKFGTASYGSLTHALFEDIIVENVDKAAMAVESVDGADIADVTFRRITVHRAGAPFFVLLGDRGATPAGDVHKVGTIDGVRFEEITADRMKHSWGSPISGSLLPNGTLHRVQNLTFDRVAVTAGGGVGAVPADPPEYAGQYPDPNLWGNTPAYGYFIRHADGVTFESSTTAVSSGDARRAIEARDAQNVVVR
jgi:glycosyl hydrolase family 28